MSANHSPTNDHSVLARNVSAVLSNAGTASSA